MLAASSDGKTRILARPPTGEVAAPDAIADASVPLAGGVGVYWVTLDGALRSAWALPWASSAYVDHHGRLMASHGEAQIELAASDGGRSLTLAEPLASPASPEPSRVP